MHSVVGPERRQRLLGDSQSRDTDDYREWSRHSRHGVDRDHCSRAVCRCQQRPDTGRGTGDAFHNRLVCDDQRAPGPGAEKSWQTLRGVEVVRRLMDADDYARFESAAEQIDEIRSEFEYRQRFADDVRIKLALVKRDVKHLRQKYGRLVTRHIDSEDDARSAVSELNRFFRASLYDLQVDLLRLYLALQDDPDFVELRQSRLREKIERYGKDFRQILDDDRVAAYHRKLKGDLSKSKWRWLPDRWWPPFGSELLSTTRRVRAVRNDFNSTRARIQGWIDAFEDAADEREQGLVFYRELHGARAVRGWYTRDLRLQQLVA